MEEVNINEKIGAFLKSATARCTVKDFSAAIEDLKAAEVLDRENPVVLYNLGICYTRTGLHRTAFEYFEKLVKLPASFVDILTVRKLAAYCLIQINEFRGALFHLETGLKLNPHDVIALNMKGYCQEKLGLLPDAKQTYGVILSIEPSNPTACNSLAYVIAKTGGDLNQALLLSKRAVEARRENPAYLDTLGYIQLLKGNRESAKNFLKKAYTRFPDSEEIKAHLRELLHLDHENK
ncbi:MAG: tetratricopeptide repeat protein [Spirochaetes bacterium]|nr:MAG: tetratricopeptide repeat protein [Spirochaetota bacterium]